MKSNLKILVTILGLFIGLGCSSHKENKIVKRIEMTAEQILGNPKYLAISYGGYR